MQCRTEWSRKEKNNSVYLDEWLNTVMKKVDDRIAFLKDDPKNKHKRASKEVLKTQSVIDDLNQLQEKYVFVPTDKAANNISVICKQFYIKTMLNELKVYDLNTSSNTYQNSDLTLDEVLRQHTQKLAKWKIELDEREMCLPFMYWSPKMHKTPSKQRFIAASACCSTKQLSTTITKCLKLIDQYHEHTARQVYHASGINAYWIINNSSKVHKMIGMSNTSKDVKNLNSYDFSTLYTAIPHTKLKKAMKSIICRAFEGKGKRCISVYSTQAA